MKSNKKNLDIYIYLGLTLLLVIWFFQIKFTCEGLGCIAGVIPIIGFMIISSIEFLFNISLLINKKKLSGTRWALFIITGLIAIFSLGVYLTNAFN